nr:MATE family efflux transporter [Micromonospora sp. DSM 115978]
MSQQTEASTVPAADRPAEPSLTRTTVRMSTSILLGMLAALALQVWTAAFLGWQGPQALYVRSIYAPLGFVILAVTEGLLVATQVAAGVAARTGDRSRSLFTMPTFLLLGGGVLTLTAVTFVLVPDVVMDALAVPPGDRSVVVGFILACAVSAALGLAPLLAGAALRGIGEAGVSAVLAIGYAGLSGVAMVVLDATTSLGILSVPLGGLVAAAVVGVATVRLLPRYGVRAPRWRVSAEALGWVRSVAVPVAATFLLLSTVSFGYLRVLRNAGTVEVSGFGLGQTVLMFFMVVAFAVGSGTAIAVNIRPDPDRSALKRTGLGVLLRTILPVYLLIGAAAFFLRWPLMRLFSSTEEVVDVAADYFKWVGPTLVLFAATLAMISYLEQVGHAAAAFMLNLTYFVVILSAAFLLPQPVGSTDLAQLLCVGNVVGFFTLLASIYLLVRRRSLADQPAPV